MLDSTFNSRVKTLCQRRPRRVEKKYATIFLAENWIYKLSRAKFINRAVELLKKLANCLRWCVVNNFAENWSEVNWDDACIVNIRKIVSRKKNSCLAKLFCQCAELNVKCSHMHSLRARSYFWTFDVCCLACLNYFVGLKHVCMNFKTLCVPS